MNANHAVNLVAYMLNERRASDDPWHELATGGLTRAQVAQTRRHMEPQEQIDAKLALFGPTTREVTEQRLEQLLDRFFAPGSEVGVDDPPGPGSTESADNVVPLGEASRRKDRFGTTTIASIVALAAAVLITWIIQRPSPVPEPLPETMASFELRFDEGWSGSMRGAGGAEGPGQCDIQYHQKRSVSVTLTPDEALGEELSVAAFAEPEQGRGQWLENLSPGQLDNGVIEIQQPVAELGLTPGVWTLTFYVTPRGQQHEKAELRALEPGAHPGVAVIRGVVCIVD